MWHRVIGQERVKKILVAASNAGRLPHAYVFIGNEGVGKDAMAIELARVLQCEQRNGNEACGECPSCRKVASMQHPDVKLITALPVGKSEKSDDGPLDKLAAADIAIIQEQYKHKAANPYHRIAIPKATVIKINSVRDIRRESAMSTLYHRKKVFIISNADEMGAEAGNTLLKTLEEPPGNTLLILTTARPEMMLQTILSRCQPVRFEPLTEHDLASALVERDAVERSKALLIARLANGSYTRARELLDTDIAELRNDVVTFIRHCLANNVVNLSQHIEKLSAEKDREFIVRYLLLMLMWFRDAFALLRGGDVINIDQQDDLKKFTTRFPHARLGEVMASVEHCISLIYKNGYIPLALTQLAVKLKRAIEEDR
jgi:DNA polymerase-3 subunit delta'